MYSSICLYHVNLIFYRLDGWLDGRLDQAANIATSALYGAGANFGNKIRMRQNANTKNVNVTKYKMAKNKWNKCKKTKYKIQT